MGYCRALLLFVTAFFYTGYAGAATDRTPSFKNNPTVFSIRANQPFTVNLDTLLSGPPQGTLSWAIAGAVPLPSWLTLDSTGKPLSGTPGPSTVGTTTFSLSVTDSATPEQAIGQLQFTIWLLFYRRRGR